MISLRSVRKTFENTRALSDLTLQVEKGQLFGYIGPNGAGKSTTIKILATLEFPDRGEVTIGGIDVVENPAEVRRIIGYMPELFGLYEQMPVHEYLDFYSRVYEASPTVVDQVIELTGLGPKREAASGTLSKGNRQRLYIARLLIHDPAVLLLDEPASGLDPLARIELRELLKELHRMGKTILISSHILADLEDICDTIGIIEAGRIVASGPIKELRESMRADFEVCMRLDGSRDAVLALLHADGRVSGLNETADRVEFRFRGEREEVHALLRRLVAEGTVYSFEASEGGLEDLFLRITRGTVT